MKIEHKVIRWEPRGGEPSGLELLLNDLGDEGWSTVAVAPAADGGYLIVLTRPSQSDVQVVQLALIHRVRQTVKWGAERAREALQNPSRPVGGTRREELGRGGPG